MVFLLAFGAAWSSGRQSRSPGQFITRKLSFASGTCTGVLRRVAMTIVGYAMAARMTRNLVTESLFRAVAGKRPGKGLVHHSDRGSQYCANDYREMLEQFGMKASMSGKGNCYDNGVPRTLNGGALQEMRVWPLGIGLQDRVSNYVELLR